MLAPTKEGKPNKSSCYWHHPYNEKIIKDRIMKRLRDRIKKQGGDRIRDNNDVMCAKCDACSFCRVLYGSDQVVEFELCVKQLR